MIAQTPPLAVRPPRTVRAAVAIGGESGSSVSLAMDYALRPVLLLPVTTTRWRLRARNIASDTLVTGTGTIDVTGAWMGSPAAPSAQRTPTTFAAAPAQALAAAPGAIVDGTEWLSGWVTDPALQFPAHQARMLSLGLSSAAACSFTYTTRGQNFNGGGAAAAAGAQGAPAAGVWQTAAMLDLRVEYECITSAPVGLFIGDSITAGNTDGTTGAMPHEGWPHVAALAQGFVAQNAGVPTSKAQDWATAGNWRWTRLDLSTPVPDFGSIMLGTNDVALGRTQAQVQADIASVIANVKALGIPIVGLCTIMPRNFAAGPEAIRVAVNDWMRTLPAGTAFCWDMDRQVALEVTPAQSDVKVIPANVHPNIAGHQRLAALARAFAYPS